MKTLRIALLTASLTLPVAGVGLVHADEEAAPAKADGAIPTVEEILAGIDKNMIFESRTSTLKMTVEGKRRTRTFEMVSFGRGESDTAMEYLAPSREKGTKMLKIRDDMWMYMPSVERTQKISGHMLREGMMGSDLSYEDMMQSDELQTMYQGELKGSEVVDGRDCWKLEMNATDETVSYPKRVSWIDKELFIPLKSEMYALSGMLLKTWTMSDIKEFEGGRQFPTRMTIKDELKANSVTTIEFTSLEFGVELEGEVFSKRWLERK